MTAQAKAVGLVFEIGLDGTILADVEEEPGAMPLLQHALLELWNRRHGRRLVAGEYQAIGRVQGAIARTANLAYESRFRPAEQERVRDLFLRLVHVDESGDLPRDTRKRVRLEGLVPAGSDLASTRSLVERLADRWLVVTTPGGEDRLTEVEVAHEALIRHWDRLKHWLDEDRAVLRLRQGIEEAANDWDRSGRDEHYLVHKGPRLVDAERIRDDPRFGAFGLEREYVDACVALREKERIEKERQQRLIRRFKQAGVVVLAAFGIVVSILYLIQRSLNHDLQVARLKDQIAGKLEKFDGSDETIDLVAGKIDELRSLDGAEADSEKTSLGTHLVETAGRMIRQERALSPDDVARILHLIGRVKDYRPGDVPGLQLALDERYRKPDLAFRFADSMDELPRIFEPGRVRPQGKSLIAGVAESPGGLGLIPSTVACRGNSEIEGRFAPGATTGRRFGLAMNVAKGRGYFFTLSVPPGSALPGRATMAIERNNALLRKAEVDIAEASVGLFAQKIDDTVRFRVGKATLEFEDSFPLSTGEPGVFGIILPEGVRLDGLAARRQQFPPKGGALEDGDSAFIAADFGKAMAEYGRVENTAEGEVKVEAGYKKALCLIELNRPREARPIFEGIAAQKGTFQARAACQVWKLLLRSGTVPEIEEANRIFDDLHANVSYRDLALVLSEADRTEILAYYRQVGSFVRIYWTKDRVRNLEQAMEIEEYTRSDSATRHRTRWRLADAYRLDGRDAEAADTLKQLLDDPGLLLDDRLGITRDYAWLMITMGAPGRALVEINKRVGDRPPDPGDPHFPMLVDRARAQAALGKYDEAEADVSRFLDLVRKPSVSYSDFAEACLFRGFLFDRRNRKDEAMRVWREGLRKHWPKDLPVAARSDRFLDGKPLRDNARGMFHFAILASLTRELGDGEVAVIVEDTLGSGDFRTTSISRTVELYLKNNKTGVFTKDHIREILMEIYGAPPSREFARREAYLEVPLIEQSVRPLLLTVAAEVRLNAIPEGGEPGFAALLEEGLQEIYREVRNDRFSNAELGMMFVAWTDGPGFLGWNRLENSLKDRPSLRGRIAYVYGRRFLTLKKPDLARHLFELCIGDLPAGSPFRKLAQEQLDKLGPK
jgi:tetratricopeptide (TPR) repeat protein